MKKFFSNQSVKAVVVLVCICVVCVGILSVLNDLWYVSDEVRFARSMNKICKGVDFEQTQMVFAPASAYGKVTNKTWAKDGSLVVLEAESVRVGYGGSVTCYVIVRATGENAGTIYSWSIKGSEGETTLNKIDGEGVWYVGEDVSNPIAMGSNKTAGATMSSNAINNAVNAAIAYARNREYGLALGDNPEADALAEVTGLLSEPYSTASYSSLKPEFFEISTQSEVLQYVFSADVDSKTVYALVYNVGDEQKFVVLNASPIKSQREEFIYSSEGLSDELLDKISANYFDDNSRIISVTNEGARSTYRVYGYSQLAVPHDYTLEVVIENGAVVSVSVVESGAVNYNGASPEQIDAIHERFAGVTLDTIDTFIADNGDVTVTGASQSPKIMTNAVRLCLEHYSANQD